MDGSFTDFPGSDLEPGWMDGHFQISLVVVEH